MILADKEVMFRICLVKLNNIVCNVKIADDSGLWMTENGTANMQLSLPVQMYYDMSLDDPFTPLSMQAFNVGTMIHDNLKNLIEDYLNNNRTICT